MSDIKSNPPGSGITGTLSPTALLEEEKLQLEVEKLRQENKKLKLDIEELSGSTGARRLFVLIPGITTLLAVATLGVTVWQQRSTDASAERHRHEDAELNRIQKGIEIKNDRARPFWTKQLDLYLEASQAAGVLATSKNAQDRAKAQAEFRELYWGRLAAVEDVLLETQADSPIETAMVQFQRELESGANEHELQQRSLELAHAIRQAIAPTFELSVAKENPSPNLRKKHPTPKN